MSGVGEAIVLAGLPGMGPRRLASAIEAWGPAEALERVRSGQPGRLVLPDGQPLVVPTAKTDPHDVAVQWQLRARAADPVTLLEQHRAAGVRVLLLGDPDYPQVLAHDIEPPAVLFVRGELSCLDRRRVAIVGTRRCTGGGAGVARELGCHLAEQGVAVVSGLALGIDGAAHRGVLDARDRTAEAAPPVGVVGSGVDVVYPPQHSSLWEAVAESGVLLSEAPLGLRPSGWRFPARNRVIAALAHAVVVVESHAAGGSLHTVTEAERRDVTVLAVPGSVRNPSAAGTNELIAQGCHPCRDATDVLVALGFTAPSVAVGPGAEPPPGEAGLVLQAFGWEPATLEHLAARTGLRVDALALHLEHLTMGGWVVLHGGWYERVAR